MARPRLIFFSDLDGTLLDHRTYEWVPAKPALAELARHELPLILNSSKTAAEVRAIRQELGNHHPYIVENGAAVVIPAGYFDATAEQVIHTGVTRDIVLAHLRELRGQGFRFKGFSDLTIDDVAQLAGLDLASADRAQQRQATEPLMWEGSADSLEAFRQALAGRDLQLLQGGRFFHAMGNFDKADGLKLLMERYQLLYDPQPVLSVALGDSPNDRAMLVGANLAVIIAGAEAPAMEWPSRHPVIRSRYAGPAGWNECVLDILSRHGYR